MSAENPDRLMVNECGVKLEFFGDENRYKLSIRDSKTWRVVYVGGKQMMLIKKALDPKE